MPGQNPDPTTKIPATLEELKFKALQYSFSNNTRYARFHGNRIGPLRKTAASALRDDPDDCQRLISWRNTRKVVGVRFVDYTNDGITVALITDEMVAKYK